ncbi:hypothetical protein [Rhizobium sp. BE258]|uniref:hypothetical protein n=1 Tax=Rhizobium sp. BE258 TaxID=2817722 RepID=UPI000DDB4C11|nr:hypothetical protein [Rhizobium sp. BE258]MDR7145022.1 hypothetical protein [Rhizobium sp. BE258]
METIERTFVKITYEGKVVDGFGADTDDALRDALRKLSLERGLDEWFILSTSRREDQETDKTVRMSYSVADSARQTAFSALDLGRHYRGAIETVKTVANLEHGFAGRTRHAVEEVAIYAIGAAKYLKQVSGNAIDVRSDLLNALSGTRWKKVVDVDRLILRRSG